MDRLAFVAEWYDPAACISRKYQLFFYLCDGTVEMHDPKTNKIFLKRMQVPGLCKKDFHIGSVISLLSRQLTIVGFADEFTRANSQLQKTFALVVPKGLDYLGSLIDGIYTQGLKLIQISMIHLNQDQAYELCKCITGIQEAFTTLEEFTCGPVVGMELLGENCIRKWRDFLGLPVGEDTEHCQAVPPRFGNEHLAKLCYTSSTPKDAEMESAYFFGLNAKTSATFEYCTCCVIKPHIIQDGLAGKVIGAILEAGFEISALEMFYLEMDDIEEFFDVYKGVVAEYRDMVSQIASGPILAMEIRSSCKDTVNAFRDFVGPRDPDIARHLRPLTIRARFGKDIVCNAVHCTDLASDGILEVEYFFKILL